MFDKIKNVHSYQHLVGDGVRNLRIESYLKLPRSGFKSLKGIAWPKLDALALYGLHTETKAARVLGHGLRERYLRAADMHKPF